MSDLDDRVRHALRDLDARVAVSLDQRDQRSEQRTSVRQRTLRILVPALAALAVLAILLGTGILGGAQDNSAPATPTLVIPDVEGPSQSVDNARRDKIYAVVAELPLRQRVGEILAPAVSTPEGFWVLSSPVFAEQPAQDEEHCLIRDRDATPTPPEYLVCDLAEYSELLLVSTDSSQILRAFPQPGGVSMSYSMSRAGNRGTKASNWLQVTPEAVYCGYTGGQDADKFANVCRVDRETLDLEGIVLGCTGWNFEGKDCNSITGRMSATGLLLPGDWEPGPVLAGVRGVETDAAGQLQLLDLGGRPRVLLTIQPRFAVAAEVLE